MSIDRRDFDAMARIFKTVRDYEAYHPGTVDDLAKRLGETFEGRHAGFKLDRWLAACGVKERS